VKNVRVADPFDVPALEAAIREETNRLEPSVIVIRRPCVFLESYESGGSLSIDNGKCTRCKLCMGISCAAISDIGGVMQINQAICAKCGLCATICRAGAIVPLSGSEGGAGNG
jgi:indolepyruvate ferredoxin oxidoreductase alpha subunit